VAAGLSDPSTIGRVEQPSGAPQALLLDRYRLDQVRSQRSAPNGLRVVLWRGTDTALGRRVAVRIVSGRTRKLRHDVAAAATRASRVADGRCVRVLDVGEGELDGEAATWIVTEWVDGPSLAAVLRREPMAPPVAVALVTQVTDALAAAARHGCHHGRLHPDEVLLPSEGVPRVTGLEVSAALVEAAAREADDVVALGALLHATMTAEWPLPGWTGLPTSATTPRRGAAREVEAVAARAMRAGYADLASFGKALGRLPSRPLDAPPPVPDRRRAEWIRRWSWRLVPPVLVAAIAFGGWQIGSALGRVPAPARAHHAALPPVTPTAPGGTQLHRVWSAPPKVTSFDPHGDGQEEPDAVGFAVDHDPSTAWMTDLYRGSSHFGGLKDGAGLLIDLGRPTAVREADLLLTAAGSAVELRAGDTAPNTAEDLPLVVSAADAKADVTWRLPTTVRARYWLLWFTNLPKVSGGYRIGVTEISLLGPSAS
jgi:hypothetical protein